jgi:small subunit ribosomal protein S23
MHNEGKSRSEAYDAARKEFYALRQEEEIERRVTREEAQWTGAQFGKGAVDVGLELEDKAYEDWKVWATKEVELRLAAQGAAFANGEEDLDAEAAEEPSLL